MKILISNDDGVQAQGIRILTKCLSRIADVYVSAPAYEQSGASHGLTSSVPLRAEQISVDGAVRAWAVNGLPADCIKLAMEQLLEEKPDFVVSGINHGTNLGTDTIYSGTVAAAMEGYLYGVSAIAISAQGSNRRKERRGNFLLAAETVRDFCVSAASLSRPICLNINVPGLDPSDVKGLKYTKVGRKWYLNAFDKRRDPSGRDYYWLQGQVEPETGDDDADVIAYAQGFISVSPLQADLTDHLLLRQLPELDLFPPVFRANNKKE